MIAVRGSACQEPMTTGITPVTGRRGCVTDDTRDMLLNGVIRLGEAQMGSANDAKPGPIVESFLSSECQLNNTGLEAGSGSATCSLSLYGACSLLARLS